MYLVDTNIWLERLLEQLKSDDVAQFLNSTQSSNFFMTDFTLHSIGIILSKFERHEAFHSFVKDTLLDGDVVLIHLNPENMERIIDTQKRYGLDFDDAYQYVAAERYDLIIVSFDTDFDKTKRGKKSPEEVLSR
jgi:hypothetical protein